MSDQRPSTRGTFETDPGSRTTEPEPLPWAFFITQGVLAATVCLAQLLPGLALVIVMFSALTAITVLAARFTWGRPGWGGIFRSGWSALNYASLTLATAGIQVFLGIVTERDWHWWLAAASALVVTLLIGQHHRAGYRRH